MEFRLMVAVAMAGMVAAGPAAAQGKSGTHGGGTAATHGKPTATGATTRGKGGDTATGGSANTSRGKSGDQARSRSGPDASTATSTPGALAGPSPIATKIGRNPEQLARITAMLPAGMTLDQAAAGFRNQGQFIAALNASKKQGVAFADLQKAMTVDGLSLGQAVRKLRPGTTSAPASTPAPDSTTTS